MKNNKVPTVWVLTDYRPGNNNQAIGVAEALGYPFEIKNIIYNKYSKLPNLIRGRSLLGVDKEKSSPMSSPWPDIVISAGRRLVPVLRYIKKQNPNALLAQMMWPGFPSKDLDIIATPEHDTHVKPREGLMFTIGAPNRITDKLLQEQAKKWEPELAKFPKPRIALLVGGNASKKIFDQNIADNLSSLLNQLAVKLNGSILVTTSRRTDNKVTDFLKKKLGNRFYFYDWSEKKENPYLGLLGLSDYIVVTGDSISMCSEACTTGKPVFFYTPDEIIPEKYKLFHKRLYDLKLALPLTEADILKTDKFSTKPLATTKEVAELIKNKYSQLNA